MKKILFLLLVFIGLVGCSEIKIKNVEKKVKEYIQSDLTKQFGKYNLVVSKVELKGDKIYQGQFEVLYDGKPYQFPVSVNEDSYQYKFDQYIIKVEAEEAVKKLVNQSMKEEEWKSYGIALTKINLFPEGANGYKGLATLEYMKKQYNVSINVKHSYDSGIMYEINPEEFVFLDNNSYSEEDTENLSLETEQDFGNDDAKPKIDYNLHESVNTYLESLENFETKKYKVRVDRMPSGAIRYAVWYSKDSVGNKPNIVLENGEWMSMGSGGNGYYTFRSGIYTYKIDVNNIGSMDDPLYVLYVLKNDEIVLTDEAI